MIKQTLFSILIAGLNMAAFNGCKSAQAEQKNPGGQIPLKPPAAVEVMKVTKGVVTRETNACGTVSGVHEATVVSQTQGVIQSVNVELGQRIVCGQVLAKVDETIQEAAYTQATNAAATAELNVKVVRKLSLEGNASDAELNVALSQASGARAALLAAKKAYDDCRITAPISGFIAEKNSGLQKGNFLSPGMPVVRIVDIATLKTSISVGEIEVGRLKKGLTAKVHVPAVSETFEARITAIGAGGNASTGSYPVEIEWGNTRDLRIKSGMSARVSIVTNAPDSVILVPAHTLIERDRRNAAMVSVDGKAEMRYVVMGRRAGNKIEIIQGLAVGELLVKSGLAGIFSGDSLEPALMVAERN